MCVGCEPHGGGNSLPPATTPVLAGSGLAWLVLLSAATLQHEWNGDDTMKYNNIVITQTNRNQISCMQISVK